MSNPAIRGRLRKSAERLNLNVGVSSTEVIATMKKPLTFILSFLLVLCVASFIVGASINSAAAFGLSGVALLPFVGIFSVGVLDYKVGGNQLTLEKRVNNLEQENTDLRESVTALLKSIYVMSHGASCWDGPSDNHNKLVSEYLAPINHLIDSNIQNQVNADIAKFMTPENP